MKYYRQSLFLLFFITLISCNSKKNWNVKNYGALADGTTINTKFIQKAIDDCSKSGGGTVLIDGGTYVSGTLLVKNNVNLKITEGTTLLGSINPNDYPPVDPFIDATGQYRGQCFIGLVDVKNASITGKGVIDGRGEMFTAKNIKKTIKNLGIKLIKPNLQGLLTSTNKYVSKKIHTTNRPFLIRVVRSSHIKLKNIHLTRPAAWTLHFFKSNNFQVDGINIYSHANKNNDAIDIDSSSYGIIKNCTIDSGDDAICIKSTSPTPTTNIEVYKCKISSHWGAIKFGTESMGDFKDIIIKDCYVYNTKGGGIKLLSADGANVENILIENIKMENVEMPIFIRLCERRLVYRNAKRNPTGTINNITIKNIDAKVSDSKNLRLPITTGLFFSGTPNHPLGNINIEDINISLPGNGTTKDTLIIVPENINQYPEFTHLGATPAYGMYARHIKNLNTKNISFSLREKDERKEIVTINVNP